MNGAKLYWLIIRNLLLQLWSWSKPKIVNIAKLLWKFSINHLLKNRWFWITFIATFVAVSFKIFKLPLLGTFGQIVLGVLISFAIFAICFFTLNKKNGGTTHATPATPNTPTTPVPTTPTPAIPTPTAHGSGHATPTTAAEGGGGGFFGVIWKILGTTMLVIVVMCMYTCYSTFHRWVNTPNIQQTTNTQTPAPPTTPKVGREKKLYRFSDYEGGTCASMPIEGPYDFYPKGGEVIITPPSPAKPWHDAPGTVNPRGETGGGTYTVCKTDMSDAWGVEVWN